MLAAEIPPQESKPKKKSSTPELSSRTKKSEKDLPKNWSEERGTTAHLRKNLAEKKNKKTSDDVISAVGELGEIEKARVATETSSAIKELTEIEAQRLAGSDVNLALQELARIEDERVRENKEGDEKIEKHDTIEDIDVVQVQELANKKLWQDAQPFIEKNIKDLKRVMEERVIFEGLPVIMRTDEARQKIDKASVIIQSNYKKIRDALFESDKKLVGLYASILAEEIEPEIFRLYPRLKGQLYKKLSNEEVLVYKTEAARSLMDKYENNPKKVEALRYFSNLFNSMRAELTSERLDELPESDNKIHEYKPSKERVRERQKEDLMAIELEINGLRAIGDARSREIIPILLKQYQAISAELLKNSEDDFFARAESGEEKSLDTLIANDIDTSEKLIRAALARNQDKPALVAEANRRLAAIAKQREEISEVLSNRNVNINSGESSYPRTMGRAGRESSVSVSRGRPGEIIGMREQREDAQHRSLSPFVAMDQFISKARTEALFSDDEYIPGILRTQRRTLMEARAKRLEEKDEVSVKDIDVTIGKIDSALRQLDLDRVNEALGTIENRLAQAKEKYTENSGNPVVASSWRNRMNMYQEQATEASRDARDLLVEDINNHLSTLGVSEKDFQTMVFGKVSPFSNTRLWWIKLRHGGEIAKIRTMIKRRNDLQGRMPE